VRTARLAKEWTQDELAAQIGLAGRSSITNIEKGFSFSFETFVKLADVLDVSMDVLAGRDR
jgi:transcriptional regulator with XRE-family HTH domain